MNDNTNPLDSDKMTAEIGQIGEILRKKRLEMALTYEDVYSLLKIRQNIVDEIENSSWDYLEQHIHLANFVKQYIKILKIEDEFIIEKINGFTKKSHSIHNYSTIDTFKNNARALNNLSDSKNSFSMKRRASGGSTSMLFVVMIIILVLAVGSIFAYEQGLFSSTTHLLGGYKSSNHKKKSDDSHSKESDENFEKEKIKIVKLTKDDQSDTVIEEKIDKEQAIKQEDANHAKIEADKKIEDNKKLAEVKKLQEAEKNNVNLTLIAIKDVWIYIKDAKTGVVVSKILKENEEFKVPTEENLYLSVSSPYYIRGSFGDKTFEHLGRKNRVMNLLQVTKRVLSKRIG